MSLHAVLESVSRELLGFAACSVVSLAEGTPVATHCREGVDPSPFEAYLAAILRHFENAQMKLHTAEAAEDFAIVTSSAAIVARPLGAEFFWLAVTEPSTNVAITRLVLRKHHAAVARELP